MAVNALQAVLDRAAKATERPEPLAVEAPRKRIKAANVTTAALPAEAAAPKKFFRPSRDNRRFVGGHFDPLVGKQLRMLAVEDDTTVQALLEEALDMLFVKKGRQKIADLRGHTDQQS